MRTLYFSQIVTSQQYKNTFEAKISGTKIDTLANRLESFSKSCYLFYQNIRTKLKILLKVKTESDKRKLRHPETQPELNTLLFKPEVKKQNSILIQL